MGLEAHFTPKGTTDEKPFTIIQGANENEWLLFSKDGDAEYRYQLTNDNGLLQLSDNPFVESSSIVSERLTGLASDWIEMRAQGVENTDDFSKTSKPGYGPDQIFVENKPFSLRQLVDLIKDNEIELTPDFQRNFIWDKTRQCRLIESILLGLPLPSIYLSQYLDGRLTVVDGLQRLSTIKAFFDDNLVLSNLEYLVECNGKKYSELASVLTPLRMRRLGQTQILCFLIDYRSPIKLKFDLFRRLNTGGKPLNNPEIRNCLTRPHAQQLLKEMVSLHSFGEATDWSVKDTRMEAREAALRFIYFSIQYSDTNPTGTYNGDIESSLDTFIDEINLLQENFLQKYLNLYDNALKNAYRLFGDYCFRKVIPSTVNNRRTPVNKLMMMTISVLLSKYNPDFIESVFESKQLLLPLSEVIENKPNLFNALTWGTNAKANMELAFKSFKEFFDEHLNDPL